MGIKISRPPAVNAAKYRSFKGIDYSRDAAFCDKQHSPNAMNMTADKSGLPEKRFGTRTLHQLPGRINGLFYGDIGEGEPNSRRMLLAHSGNKLYRFTDSSITLISDGLDNTKSNAFFMLHKNKSKLFILTGEHYFCYDGNSLKEVKSLAKIPVVLIGKAPSGGGKALEPVNLLTGGRIEKFAGDNSSKVYQLAANGLDPNPVEITLITENGTVIFAENLHFTVNRALGQVTFNDPPIKPHIEGEDNIVISYTKTVEGYEKRVSGCRFFAYYGLGGSNRIFLTGHPLYKAYDRWCDINDPTYFPDTNYSIVGSDNTAVMGYAKIGEYLVVIKEDNRQDSTIYIRHADMQSNEAIFPLKQGITGAGAISPYSFVNLIDEPLFLSRSGVYAVTSNTVTAERTLQNRSYTADNRLCREEGLEKAIGVEWNGYYLLAVNKKAYLFDSRQKTATEDGGFCYECYPWDNIEAECFLSVGTELYFGTADGRIVKFNTDITTTDRYSDDGKPIAAFFETAADDNGTAERLKTLLQSGCALTIKPSVQTGVDIYVSRDGEPYEPLAAQAFSLISWVNSDFGAFTFLTTETPKITLLKKKIKRYTSLQFKFSNDKLNQSFGIYEFTYRYTIGNTKK